MMTIIPIAVSIKGVPAARKKLLTTIRRPPRWLHQRRASDFSQMSDLPLQLRSQLAERYYINAVQVEKKLVSAIDGTQKFLYRLMDGECVEGVLMEYHYGNSLCISTQVGCRG